MDYTQSHRLTRASLGLLALLTLSGMILEAERASDIPPLTMALRGAAVVSVEPGGAADRAGIRRGDRIVRVGEEEITLGCPVHSLIAHLSPGDRIDIELLREGTRRTIEFVAPRPHHLDILWRVALAAVGVLTLLIGLLVFFKKPRQLTLIFALVCYGMGSLFHPPYVPRIPALTMAGHFLQDVVTVFIPPLLVHLFLLFPFRQPVLERHPRRQVLLYLPSAVLLVYSYVAGREAPGTDPDGFLVVLGNLLAFLLWVFGIGGALWLFVRSYRRARTEMSRAKVRIALWGTVLGLFPIGLTLIIQQLRPGFQFPGDRLAVLSTVLVPLSFGYAIVRHGIFDVTHIVRRSLGFTVEIALILVAYFGTYLLLHEVLGPSIGLSGLWVSFLSMLVAGALLVLIHRHLQGLLARAVGGEPRDHQTLLYELGHSLSGLTARGELVRVLTEFTGEALRSDSIAYFETNGDGALETVYLDRLPVDRVRRYRISRNLSAKLLQMTQPIDRGDLESDLPFGYLSPGDQDVFGALGTEVIVPLRSPTALQGLLFVGGQMLGEPFTSEDLRAAETIAHEGSLALENAALTEQVRLGDAWRDEVDVARDLQERLLPMQMPQVDSLEISGFSVPAQGVGGDYYDCFRTPWGDLALAIGDASGKGVSGAILMANLQGLVKSEGIRREAPAQIVKRINRQLCEMRKPERYVTFCLARIDPASGTLSYSNAGHPSPLLVRTSGRIEELTLGGLPLGIRPQASYDGGRTVMRPGDVLLLYTDGITERRREQVMFDEGRLQSLAREHRRLSAQALQKTILTAVREFAATPLDDDTTLLVVKML